MKKFVGFYNNGKYQVGCNGATVYVYDMNGVELARFKDIKYSYAGVFKPNTNIFVVKSTDVKFAVYDLDELKLIKIITVTEIDVPQDGGFAFSYSGDLFYYIEHPVRSTATQLSVYDGSDFSKIATYFVGDKMVLDHIEVYPDEIYLLGFIRGADGTFDYGFVSKYADGEIIEPKKIKSPGSATIIPKKRADSMYHIYLSMYKNWEIHGFTDECLKWSWPYKFKKGEVSLKQVYEAAEPLSFCLNNQ